MNTIKVEKNRLLNKVRENREKHIVEFKEAITVYRKELISRLEQELSRLKQNDVNFDYSRIRLEVPVSYVAEYDRVISQLEWHADDFVELTTNQVDQYINDNWSWTGGFVNTANFYKSAK